ncbi:sodium-translocating pyrophosphatase [Candidatus Woesearchaeota archaeon]|nr:sodium-translocating pyrophosphatase [Candidatus Woesearchaeota archaeon]
MWIVWIVSILSLAFAVWLMRDVLKRPTGTPKMQEISDLIRIGANAFMKRQYITITIISIVFAVAIYVVYRYIGHAQLGLITSLGFIFGAACSAVAGIIGMWTAVRANVRVAAGAQKSMNDALVPALRGGAVSGIFIVALSLLGIAALFSIMGFWFDVKEIPFMIVGYGFGASFVALFAQLGGGIYTKAADVGADLVGKIEKNIPEDDPRNPAVIADLVGDNVGDCAGRGADLFESTAAENIGAMIIGVALFPVFGLNGILFPLIVRSFGLLASIVGVMVVRVKEKSNPMWALTKGYFVTSVLATIAFYFVTMRMLGNIWFFYAGLVGIVTSILIVLITMYYTESEYRPVKAIAKACDTGHATNIIRGFAVALECTAAPVVVLSAALVLSYMFGARTGIEHGGLYGTAIATMGMLATAAYVLAMDTFGPITDNAGGIVEFSGAPKKVRARTDKLDSVGNTTKALTKGYAIGSAALAAFLLFSAYQDEVVKYVGEAGRIVNIGKIEVFVGAFIGAMLVFLFSSMAIKAVGDAAHEVVFEVRRQFKSIKGIMEGKRKPDYARCVDICTKAALREMILPGLLIVAVTIAVGLILKAEAVAAFLMVGTISGILMALVLNTGGGAWDNAKKHLEAMGRKGSIEHQASVTGDTVGDPFKDTAGPSLHVLIKLLGTLTLVLAPLFI